MSVWIDSHKREKLEVTVKLSLHLVQTRSAPKNRRGRVIDLACCMYASFSPDSADEEIQRYDSAWPYKLEDC